MRDCLKKHQERCLSGRMRGHLSRKRRTVFAAALAALAISVPSVSYAGNWKFEQEGWKYQNNDGSVLASQWFQDEDGCWYYLDHEGKMMTDRVTPDGYTVGQDGAWIQKIPQEIRYQHIVPDETCDNYAGKHSEPIFGTEMETPLVALSFDSGSVYDYTDQILDTLDQYQVRSTFFLTKDWMEEHGDSVRKIYERGHEIGNHSVSHPDMTEMTPEQISSQIQETHNKIRELTGREAFLFRAPYGAYNTKVVDTVKNNGYYCIQWTVDSLDWKNLGVQPILDRVLNSGKLKNGSIVLMHDGAEYTPAALGPMIEEIQARGYQIVPVSELIYTRNYKIDGYGIQHPAS